MTIAAERYFFSGIGGSGMLPLAALLRARGADVAGSDRAFDAGRDAAKADWLRGRGVALFPQDGAGVVAGRTVVASAAVEAETPDLAAARAVGAPVIRRADLLSALFNAGRGIGAAGTSGKSTTTAMLAHILATAGRSPTVVAGAVMRNFETDATPYASFVAGDGPDFVAEVDESDGSIALYDPFVGVVTNISEDHKPLAELRDLFAGFAARSARLVVGADNAEAAALADAHPAKTLRFGIESPADLVARDLAFEPFAVAFTLAEPASGARARVALPVPGRHNVENALAAIAAARALGLPAPRSARALESFRGVARRFERVGEAAGVTVIDDFAHNPDKIAATLAALRAFPGRVLALFQPQGYGPLRLMEAGFVAAFAEGLGPDDRLAVTEPVYFGGTVDRSVGAARIVAGVAAAGRQAEAFADREAAADRLLALARPGDRIAVMGARDDSLTDFARSLMRRLAGRPATDGRPGDQ